MQILARKWKTFNLNDLNDGILQYTYAIPTLPGNQFENAIEQINVISNDNKEKYVECIDELRSFMKFIVLWWQPTAESISFEKDENDSINISEHFDRHFGSKMGSLSPDVFQFSGK